MPRSFCVPECLQKGVKSSTGEKGFFLVSLFASGGETNEGKKFMIAEGTAKVCLLHFRLEDLRKCVTYHI